jgi:hypothetical protein
MEAIQSLEHANTISIGHIPAMNRRANASIQKDLAIMYAELDRSDAARDLIRPAERELAGDAV